VDSRYEPGQRSGAWQKMGVNQGREFVIGGYTPLGRNFDPIIFGYYDDQGRLVYVARTPERFRPGIQGGVVQAVRGLETERCIREPAGGEERALWPGIDGGENCRLPMAQAGAGGPVRVRRLDAGWPSEALAVRGS
jgi:hypothetical protein